MRYALVAPDGTIHKQKNVEEIDLTAGVRSGYKWLPVENVTNDTSTLPPHFCTTDPVQINVLADKVERVRTRRDMTAKEQNDAKTEIVKSQMSGFLGDILLAQENRIRALEGKQPILKQSMMTALKALL